MGTQSLLSFYSTEGSSLVPHNEGANLSCVRDRFPSSSTPIGIDSQALSASAGTDLIFQNMG